MSAMLTPATCRVIPASGQLQDFSEHYTHARTRAILLAGCG